MSNIWLFDIWPSIVTLSLSWHMGNIGSANSLVEVNVSAKFEENPSIGIGFIESGHDNGDRRTDGHTDTTKWIHYSPPKFCGGGIITRLRTKGAVYGKERVGRSVWARTVLPGQVLKDGALSSMSRTSTISRNWLVSDEFIVSVARICSCSWENNRRVSISSEENTCNKVNISNHGMDNSYCCTWENWVVLMIMIYVDDLDLRLMTVWHYVCTFFLEVKTWKYLCEKLNHCMDIMKWWNVWLFTNSLTWARS